MELYELIGIFRKNQKWLWYVVAGFVLVGFLYWWFQPVSYVTNVALNISRSGVQQTTDYRYDGFYRLQADERFADTVVQWLSVPGIEQDIFDEANATPMRGSLLTFGKSLDARRLSSQLITVRYRTSNHDEAVRVAQALGSRINDEAQKLNAESQEESWFTILADEPVVSDGRVGWIPATVVMAAFGIFFGFWTVLFRHYFLSAKDRKRE